MRQQHPATDGPAGHRSAQRFADSANPRGISIISGSVHQLKAETRAAASPFMPADAAALRAGHNPPLVPSCAMGRVLKPFFQHRRIDPCHPDLLLDETTCLEPFGVPGRIVFDTRTYTRFDFATAAGWRVVGRRSAVGRLSRRPRRPIPARLALLLRRLGANPADAFLNACWNCRSPRARGSRRPARSGGRSPRVCRTPPEIGLRKWVSGL